ncbi:MAG: hypothetical protein ACRCXC_03345 [Legionella sp.]
MYATLIHRLIDWSLEAAPAGFACAEKDQLLSALTRFNAFFKRIEELEKKTSEKEVEASSCEELFALNNGPKKNPIYYSL